MSDLTRMISIDRLKEYLYQRNVQLNGFYAGMRRAYILRAALLVFTGAWLLPSFRYKNNGRYLISSIKHLELIEPDKVPQLVLFGGPLEFFHAIRINCGFINSSNFYLSITLSCFTKIKSLLLFEYFGKIISKKISQIKNLEFLLIDSDGLPYKRALCLVAQRLGKKVVCIQHGIFPNPMKCIDGSLCDLNLVIDDDQLSVFLKSGLCIDTLVLLESVSKEKSEIISISTVQPKVILVGEGWVSHDLERHRLYKALIKKLKHELNEVNIKAVYRPHPSERFSFWTYWDILPIEFSKRSKNVFPWNIYIGTMSSLLVEALKSGATSIQITDLFPLQENYKKYGAIQSTTGDVKEKLQGLNMQSILHNQVLYKKIRFLDLDKIAGAIPSIVNHGNIHDL
jgi:hypothetical protein